MFKNRKIGNTKASEAAAKLKAEKLKDTAALDKAFKKNAYIIGGCLALVLIVVFGLLFNSLSKNRYLKLENKAIKAKMTELSKPQYDPVSDFILSQCGDEGVFCKTTETSNPSLEMLKFLVDFREQPNKQYRLIFELRSGGEQKNGEVLSCDGGNANFYVCQEITASSPTDVIRAFERSYKSLSGEAIYTFNLMVKPVGDLDYVNPVAMKVQN